MSFELKKGARRPVFVVVLKDEFGQPTETVVDLTTATSAAFSMRAKGGGTVKVSLAAATISNPTGGEVTYSWASADTDTAGEFEAEVKITWSDGKTEVFPGGPSSGSYWYVTVTDAIA